ncbi:ribonuclease catalytic domain-containing protein [Leptolyngbya sp. FACHB-261]|uniref:ribonuclease catalytic domain-containing protein n=1 Tax=Leptolyngbya sp. FACHB-261 TaxID=2692806 RepID=UPI001685C63D|nr:RNB domain-containing ribonuclease [Leptolyngbya sp. FACHB-261]MBD2103710.1 VacB/RNase II family 3'-5' exoribonuclease [Leptolyngbya sp. FACHB-261]
MEKGTLVEFRDGRDYRLGVVERPEGKKHWQVLDEVGQAHILHPRQIAYTVTGQPYTHREIAAFKQTVQPYLDPESLEVAWEFLMEEGRSTPIGSAEMAQILFTEQSPPTCYAAHRLLTDDRLYFKQKGDLYEPRSGSQVAELKHQLEVETQRAQEWLGFVERVQQQLSGVTVEWSSAARLRIEALERYATWGEEASDRLVAHEVLNAVQYPSTEQGAFTLLVNLGLWSVHENLSIRKAQLPTRFSAEVLRLTQEYLAQPIADPDAESRLDLTHLKTYTIDDESTREIDDGLSVETLADGRQRLWIHIADPTRWIQLGDGLEREARRRATSVYLPTGSLPMFPIELAAGPMSLVQGRACEALSFGVDLSVDGAIESYRICASRVQPTYRLTYSDVDEMLQLGISAEPEIAILNHWATVRYNWRRAQGAIPITLPETVIKVSGRPNAEPDVNLEVLEDSVSRQLVAEMMILAGEVGARFAQDHQIPVPFRSQAQPELPPDEVLLQLPPGPVREFAICRCMTRSEVGTVPYRHAGLGLAAYTQVTSPIRRYSDLVAHFQLKAYLRGETLPFTTDELKQVIASVDVATYDATQVERQTNRYWELEFLRRQKNETWQALMLVWLREHEGLALILLEDLGLKLPMRMQRNIALGEMLSVQVSDVDPRRDLIQFREVQRQDLMPQEQLV